MNLFFYEPVLLVASNFTNLFYYEPVYKPVLNFTLLILLPDDEFRDDEMIVPTLNNIVNV